MADDSPRIIKQDVVLEECQHPYICSECMWLGFIEDDGEMRSCCAKLRMWLDGFQIVPCTDKDGWWEPFVGWEEKPMKYRKKPVVIEAYQWQGDFVVNGVNEAPIWLQNAQEQGVVYFKDQGELYIHTLEGEHHASVGDYIIQGVDGELYPCKPDIFEKTYEKVEEPEEVEYVDYVDI